MVLNWKRDISGNKFKRKFVKTTRLPLPLSDDCMFILPFSVCLHRLHREREVSKRDPGLQEDAHRVHERATGGAGEGVPLQPLPVQTAAGGDGQAAQPPREADQDLVSEPEDEAEERWETAGPHQHRHYLLLLTPVLPLRPGQPHSVKPGLCPSGRGLPAGLSSAHVPTTAAAPAGVPGRVFQIPSSRIHARPAVWSAVRHAQHRTQFASERAIFLTELHPSGQNHASSKTNSSVDTQHRKTFPLKKDFTDTHQFNIYLFD